MYLGIDLGTSEVKALVIDENHEVIASHSAPLSIQRPHPHWSEQAPELWWEATEYLMATLREKCAQHWPAIKAIGLSGQMHGAVLLDAEGRRSVRPFCGTTPAAPQSAPSWRRWRRSCIRWQATWRCRALPRRSCCGCAVTSRNTFSAPPRCCCPRIICATG